MIHDPEEQTFDGDVVSAEHSSYWGDVVGVVRCLECQTEISISPMGSDNDRKCRCGIVWTLELAAVGRKPGGSSKP